MSAANRLPDYLDQMIQGATDAVTFTEGMDEGDFLADLKRSVMRSVVRNII